MMKIKKGDTVRVIAGSTEKGKGKEGKVISVDKENGKVLVEGINMVTKHAKPSAANQNGGIIQKEAPIDASNVMLVVKIMCIYKLRYLGRQIIEFTILLY